MALIPASSDSHPLAHCHTCGLRSIADPELVNDISVGQSEAEYFQSYSSDLRRVADRRVEYVRRYAPPPAKCLDFGASYGFIAECLQSQGYDIETFEKSPQALASMRRRGFRVYEELNELPEAAFDIVTTWHVLEHLPEPGVALQRLVHTLKPGGSLFAAVPNANGLFARLSFEHWIWTMPWHLHYFTTESLARLFASYGLRIASAHTDTGDVAALELLAGGVLLRTPSRLSRQNAEITTVPQRSLLRRIGAPILRSLSAPMQQFGKLVGLGEEIVVHAVKA